MNSIPSRFPCGGITLEGELLLPKGSGPFPGVIVCHPHPLYGGDMLNNVVSAICQALPRQSIAAFRFNFRGVGGSEGTFGGGIAEREDVKAALAWLLSTPNIDTKKIGLAGYSFGAGVAEAVALQDERVSLLALVSPALADALWEQLKSYHQPKLLIAGDADAFVSSGRFQQHVRDMAEPRQYQVIAGADHFWWGYEEAGAQEVAGFFVAGFSKT